MTKTNERMNKWLTTYLAAICSLMISSCDDFHTSDNGNLDGFWQLTDVDTLSNGRSADVRDREIFWAVQTDLLEMRNVKKTYIDILFRFQLDGQKLTLSQPVANNRLISDSIITDRRTVEFYGLGNLTETLKVLKLENKKMALENERLRMYFRKY